MTAIAAILKNGEQIIIGDVMLSAPGRTYPSDKIYVPTGMTAVQDLGNYHPVGFVQKCVIINPWLCFAWAGRSIFGSWACRYLRENYGLLSNFSEEIAKNIVEELSRECTEEDAFMVSVVDRKSGMFFLKHVGAYWAHVLDTCDLFVAGSGSTHIHEAAERLGDEPGASLLSWVMTLIGMMIEREVASRTSTKECYGAAWDIVHLTSEGFKKLDPLIFSQWRIVPHGDSYTYGCECLLGTKYFGSRMSIKALVNGNQSGPTLMYADAWPPDRFGRPQYSQGPAEFTLDSPNQVLALKWKTTSGGTLVKYYPLINADESSRLFREVSTENKFMNQLLNLELFDQAFFEFKST